MRKIYISIQAVILLGLMNTFVYSGTNNSEVVDRVVAVVNEDIISLTELSGAVKIYAEKIKSMGYPPDKEREMLFKVREDMLEQLIIQKLTDQESKKYNISVGEKEIDSAVERVKEVNSYTDEELRQILAKDDLSMDAYRDQIKKHLIRSKLLNYQIKSKIVITRDEIKAYYESNLDKYRGERKYNLKNIIRVFGPNTTEDEKQNILSKMEDIYLKLKGGQAFADISREYEKNESDIKSLDLGKFNHNELSKEVQEAIKGLKSGDYTKVFETDIGYQIIYIETMEEKPDRTLEEVYPEIQDILFRNVVEKQFESWIEDLRKKSHIKVIK